MKRSLFEWLVVGALNRPNGVPNASEIPRPRTRADDTLQRRFFRVGDVDENGGEWIRPGVRLHALTLDACVDGGGQPLAEPIQSGDSGGVLAISPGVGEAFPEAQAYAVGSAAAARASAELLA
jgi:hypothetical protein